MSPLHLTCETEHLGWVNCSVSHVCLQRMPESIIPQSSEVAELFWGKCHFLPLCPTSMGKVGPQIKKSLIKTEMFCNTTKCTV